MRRPLSNFERTNWRDQEISKRHRLWGDDLYAVDVDFCMVEYYSRRGVLLVDYKHFVKKESTEQDSNLRSTRVAAERVNHFAIRA